MDYLGRQKIKSNRGVSTIDGAQEWKNHLRSAIHPALFAIVYSMTSTLSWVLHLSPTLHANLLIATPKLAQALCAALGDFYTWRLGQQVFGDDSKEAWTVVGCASCIKVLANRSCSFFYQFSVPGNGSVRHELCQIASRLLSQF